MILIDMAMPDNCGECRLMESGWCFCIDAEDWQTRGIELDRRPDWCPLQEVTKKLKCESCIHWTKESPCDDCVEGAGFIYRKYERRTDGSNEA